jgi:predicted GNAT family acetyltransferase
MTGVRNNSDRRRFELAVEGDVAFVEYRLRPGVVSFPHTFTPSRLRGRGHAARVVQAALDWARAEGLRVEPQCWYVRDYIAAHPAYTDLLRDPAAAEGGSPSRKRGEP